MKSAVFLRAALAANILGLSWPAGAQETETARAADREVVRRQGDLAAAAKLSGEGQAALQSGDCETAYVKFLDALDHAPASAPASKIRGEILAKFSRAGVLYAQKLIADGKYGEAEKVAKTILLPQYDPGSKEAVKLLSRIEQDDYFSKTVTPQFANQRDEVAKDLQEAQGFFEAARFDLAMKRYEQALAIDPYNIAARRGMEKVNLEKSIYYGAAYDETRGRLLWQVESAWERPVRRFQNERSTASQASSRSDIRGTEAITAKLNRIIIPKIDLRDTSVREAVEFLKQRSRDLDAAGDSSGKEGVNIVLKLGDVALAPAAADQSGATPAPATPPADAGGNADTRVTLSLSNVPLIEAIRYLTELAGLKYKIEPYAVSIVPLSENTTDLVTKEYRVPPGFIPTASVSSAATSPAAGAAPINATETRIGTRSDALQYLSSQGIPFPPGSFAQYVPAGSRLIVKTTPDAIDLLDSLVDAAAGTQPTQVEIEAKFLEITQTNLSELGFSWLVGPVSIGGGVYGSGGTQGYGTTDDPTSPSTSDYPFNSGGTPIGSNPVTSGLRSGSGTSTSSGITANSIDSLLGSALTGAAPGIFGISGVFTNPQFQMVIRALSQKKGVDLMTAPKVTTKSGHKATVRVVREFPYPTEFNPPEPPPASTGSSSSSSTTTYSPGTIVSQGVVTPSTPTAFETRNLGVTLEVEPVIGPDGYTIDLNLSPEVVEFDGFINYGSPILSPVFQYPATIATEVATQNVINQPIFSTRKVTTSVSIWDGQTLALGGLIREDVQKVQDKVPILGDIPLAGRLFRTNIDQKIKRNLIIFVTARLMDAEGKPVREEEETEEIVEPLKLDEIPAPAFESPGFGK